MGWVGSRFKAKLSQIIIRLKRGATTSAAAWFFSSSTQSVPCYVSSSSNNEVWTSIEASPDERVWLIHVKLYILGLYMTSPKTNCIALDPKMYSSPLPFRIWVQLDHLRQFFQPLGILVGCWLVDVKGLFAHSNHSTSKPIFPPGFKTTNRLSRTSSTSQPQPLPHHRCWPLVGCVTCVSWCPRTACYTKSLSVCELLGAVQHGKGAIYT